MSYLLEQIEVKKLIGLNEQEELSKIKSFVSKIYEDAGYSNSPWKNIDHYDLWSTWFYVEEDGQIFSAMRITEKNRAILFLWKLLYSKTSSSHRNDMRSLKKMWPIGIVSPLLKM